MATPRIISVPRIASKPNVAPQNFVRSQMQTPRNLTAQGPAKTQLNAGNAKTQLNAGNIAGAANSNAQLNARNIAGPGNTVGQGGRNPGGPNQFQLAAAGNRPAATRVLQNRFMANKFAAAGLGGRAGLAHATFKGNFAGKGRMVEAPSSSFPPDHRDRLARPAVLALRL